jgi:hypothetical protein
MEMVFLVVTPGNTGLVGDNYGFETISLGRRNQIKNPGYESNVILFVYVSFFLIDNTIPVKKKCSRIIRVF